MSDYILTTDMSEADWLKARRNSIGASEAAAVVGLHPYMDSADVWIEKMSDEEPDTEEGFDNLNFWLGNEIEDITAKRFTLETDKDIRKDNKILLHPEYDFLSCNLDRVVTGENVPAELKMMRRYDGEILNHHYIQVQHQLAITGAPYAYYVVLENGWNRAFHYERIERNEEFIEELIHSEVQFWRDHIETEEPPIPKTYEAASKIFEKADKGTVIEIPKTREKLKLLSDGIEAHQQIRQWKQIKKDAKDKLASLMGSAEEIQYNGETAVTWKNIRKTQFNEAAFMEAHPDIAEEYSETVLDTKRLKKERKDIWSEFSYKEHAYRRFVFKDVPIEIPQE